MPTRMQITVTVCVVLLTACSPPGAASPTTTNAVIPIRTPAATRALPPAHTPTITLTPLPTLPPTPEMEINGHTAALLPAFAGDAELFPAATRYWIEVNADFDPQGLTARLEGLARIRFTNPLEVALRDLVLMLWPNDSQYQATMTTGPALIDGHLVQPEVELGGIALRIRLPHALSAGKTLDLSLPFWIEVSQIHSVSPQRFGIAEGVLIAPTFYPLVPRLVDGEWQAEVAPAWGDTTNSDIAFYHVEITAPGDLALVASGTEIAREQDEDGNQRVVYVTGPMRDFAFALGTLETESRNVGDVVLRAWVLPEHIDDLGKVLDAAAAQVRLLSEFIGPYPYVELDLVDAPGAFSGIEYPGLVFIGTLGTAGVVRPTVHEVAHQWFYGLIGGDQLHEPWLDEAAAAYSEVLYYEHTDGVGRATGYLTDLRAVLRGHPDSTLPIGLSVGDYSSPGDYGLFVYSKGTLFFDALRREFGDRVFFEFMHIYYQQYRYRFASARDFQAVAEETCGRDLDEFFNLWVYQGGELPVP